MFQMPHPLSYEMPNFAILFFMIYSQNHEIRKFNSPQKKAPYGRWSQNCSNTNNTLHSPLYSGHLSNKDKYFWPMHGWPLQPGSTVQIIHVSSVFIDCLHWATATVSSRLSEPRLSEPRLSVSGHLDVGSRHHVFGTSGKKTLQSLEFCYRRKQICCTNNFRECYKAFSMQYGI